MLPVDLTARIDSTAWTRPAVFDLIAARGVGEGDMLATYNMGIGYTLCVEPGRSEALIAALSECGHEATVIGEVMPGAQPVIETG